MKSLYYLLLRDPLLNILVFFYNTVAAQDLGLAIIFLTVLIRIILFPLFQNITRHQLVMQELQPKLEKIKVDHKDSPEKQVQATMNLFKEHKVNPFSGLFLTLIQLPILLALYSIFNHIFDPGIFDNLYSFVGHPGTLNNTLLGLINLQNPSILLVGLAAILQYVQTKLILPPVQPGVESSAAQMGKIMMYIGPIFIFVIFSRLPAALSLYLITTTLFSIAQQTFINRKLKHEKLAGVRN